jgi:hypothetical protein
MFGGILLVRLGCCFLFCLFQFDVDSVHTTDARLTCKFMEKDLGSSHYVNFIVVLRMGLSVVVWFLIQKRIGVGLSLASLVPAIFFDHVS